MHAVQGFLSVVARLMITAIFLSSAVMNKITQFNNVAEMMAAKDVPQQKVLLAGAIAFLLLGSLSVILGYKARLGSLLLLIFLAATLLRRLPVALAATGFVTCRLSPATS